MAAHNRHLRGDTNDVLIDIHGNTTIEAGDFIVRNGVDGGMAGAAATGLAADNYGFPLSSYHNTASTEIEINGIIQTNFVGVAMESSPSGTTEKITVASDGVFRYPLYTSSAVTIGTTVSTTSGSAHSASSKQAVSILGTANDTTAYLGYCVKTESGASFVDFQIRTAYGTGGRIA